MKPVVKPVLRLMKPVVKPVLRLMKGGTWTELYNLETLGAQAFPDPFKWLLKWLKQPSGSFRCKEVRALGAISPIVIDSLRYDICGATANNSTASNS